MSLVPYKITALSRSDATGLNIIPEAEVSIIKTVGGAYAQLWTSSAGTTPISNPFNCDTNGEKEVWLIGGDYTITVDGGQSWDVRINGASDVTVIDTWADIATTPAVVGQTFILKQHTSGNLGGGTLVAVSGSVTDDHGTKKNSATSGVYLRRVNYNSLTVEMFGALGDGSTNDSNAFLYMAASTSGIVNASNKEYFVENLIFPDYDNFEFNGSGMPIPDISLAQMIGGTIILGSISIRANNVSLKSFGLDNGAGRSLSGITDGLVVNSLVSEVGNFATIDYISSLGPNSAGTTHAILVQGYEKTICNNIYCGKHQFGLVLKCRNNIVSNVSGDDIRTALVYPKSDLEVYGGDVGNSRAFGFEVSNVSHMSTESNSEASAVYMHASTDTFSSARVSNVVQTYGLAAVRIQGGGSISSPAISNISISNITGERSEYTLYSGGYTYDWAAVNLKAINTVEGKLAYMDGNTTNWSISNSSVTVSDASITGTVVMICYGTGQWSGISVRNPYNNMMIGCAPGSLKSIRSGVYSGDIYIENEGYLSGINGAVADSEQPRVDIAPNSIIRLSGRFDLTSSSNKYFCNIPFSTGLQMVFACGGIDSSNNYVTTAVRLNDFQLSIEPSLPSGFKKIDLSNIQIKLI